MICPNDSSELHRAKIISHYGQAIDIEQCIICGGIWFDESELFRAKQGEAEKVELLKIDALQNPSTIERSPLVCPKDRSKLYRFN